MIPREAAPWPTSPIPWEAPVVAPPVVAHPVEAPVAHPWQPPHPWEAPVDPYGAWRPRDHGWARRPRDLGLSDQLVAETEAGAEKPTDVINSLIN